MKVDGNLITALDQVGARVAELERLGFDGAISVETSHDPFIPLALAAEHSESIELITAVAIALARSPMTLAYTANDLQAYSGGRLILGLGSQVRAHIVGRFGMPWSHPAARMREFICALRAIWEAWNTGSRLDFRGDVYQHTLMTPFFSPGANPHGAPRVFLGALGDRMAEVAGEVADGVLVHPMVTERFLRERAVPAVEAGLRRSERGRDRFQVAIMPFVITGDDEAEIEAFSGLVRAQIAFYGSTPAYRPVLELHGWGGLQGELNALSKQGRWDEMGGLIDDGMLDTFAVRALPEGLTAALGRRYGDVADRIALHVPFERNPGRWQPVIAGLRATGAAASVR